MFKEKKTTGFQKTDYFLSFVLWHLVFKSNFATDIEQTLEGRSIRVESASHPWVRQAGPSVYLVRLVVCCNGYWKSNA